MGPYKLVPQIDIANAPICLACPLAECVHIFEREVYETIRHRCPVWLVERERDAAVMRRWREKKRLAFVSNNERKPKHV